MENLIRILYEVKNQDSSVHFEAEGVTKEVKSLYSDFISHQLNEIEKALSCKTTL